VNLEVRKLEAGAVESMQWANRRDLQSATGKTEAALFTSRRGHRKDLRPKLTAKMNVGDTFVRFNKEAT